MKHNKEKKKIRLYRFYNMNVSKDGEPFAMCDYHKETYQVPPSCIMNKIADKSKISCNLCDE
ncbi:hypothetical protein LCGC14_0641330 [marine sediment metagenome]|uniref:Uncharacterized protein n=1 Tax=marine sediment metagenome TaxID=412755 RepID=A0A0F9U7E8_9ZZZZ|nr:hypothetical protein [bacterium]